MYDVYDGSAALFSTLSLAHFSKEQRNIFATTKNEYRVSEWIFLHSQVYIFKL